MGGRKFHCIKQRKAGDRVIWKKKRRKLLRSERREKNLLVIVLRAKKKKKESPEQKNVKTQHQKTMRFNSQPHILATVDSASARTLLSVLLAQLPKTDPCPLLPGTEMVAEAVRYRRAKETVRPAAQAVL